MLVLFFRHSNKKCLLLTDTANSSLGGGQYMWDGGVGIEGQGLLQI